MASGKKSKERRRVAAAAPAVRSKGRPAGRRANPKVLAVVGAAVVLAAIGIGLALALGGSKSPATSTYPAIGTLTNALPGAGDVNTLFKGIPQSGFTLGAPKAPVKMVEYVDLQCPFCQQFETQVMPDIVARYVRTGKVNVELRPLDFIGPDSSRGRDALIATASQNRAFNFAALLYDNQGTENTGWLSDTMIGDAVSSIPGIRVRNVLSLRSTAAVARQAHAFDAQQAADGVTATPTIFVGRRGAKGTQVALSSPTDRQSLVKALDSALAS
jgi:protein-disulfide isomerase